MAGVDDSGRGAIAGPLTIAVLWHPAPKYLQYIGATDSKKTDHERRMRFIDRLKADGRACWGLAAATPEWINKYGLDTAEAQAVHRAFNELLLAMDRGVRPQEVELFVDGHKSFPNLPGGVAVHYLPKGDGFDPLIAGASILARVLYDDLIRELGVTYPDWDLGNGYATEGHLQQLYERGLQPWHRRRAASNALATYCIKKRLPFPTWLREDKS